MSDLISRSALLEAGSAIKINEAVDGWNELPSNAKAACIRLARENKKLVMAAPAVDAVSRAAVEQIQWERDTAIQQLKDHNIPFGGIVPDVVRVVRCKDCFYNDNGCCTHSENYDDTHYRADYFCADGLRRADDGRSKAD